MLAVLLENAGFRDHTSLELWKQSISTQDSEVKASDVFLFVFVQKTKPEGLSGRSKALQTGSESITYFLWSSPNLNPEDHLWGGVGWGRGGGGGGWGGGGFRLQDLQTGSESIRRAFSSLKMIPRDRLCGL